MDINSDIDLLNKYGYFVHEYYEGLFALTEYPDFDEDIDPDSFRITDESKELVVREGLDLLMTSLSGNNESSMSGGDVESLRYLDARLDELNSSSKGTEPAGVAV